MKLLVFLIALLTLHQSIASQTSNIMKWQKFDSPEDELPVVEMKVNNQKVRAFFDTGANTIAMGEQTARKLGLLTEEPKSKSIGTFAGGKQAETFQVKPVMLTVGNETFENMSVIVVKGADENKWKDITVGVDLLRQSRILMDYKNKTMTVLKKSELTNNSKTISLPFEFVGPTHIMVVRSEINGKEALLHFDTGGTFSLNLFAPKVKELGLEIEKRLEGGHGGAGQEVTQVFYKQSVKTCISKICETVKPIAIEGQEAMWVPVNKLYGKEISGQISHQFFIGKKVEYDLPEKRILILAD